ncbi:MAG: phycobiliprotein lyase [Cyanobacteria bacterium J06638_20]
MKMFSDAMEFFQFSAGTWRSQRTTHHLPFRRAETGDSDITVESLPVEHPKVLEICALHEVDPNLAIGGAHVTWQAAMAWDQEDDENHEGSTIFVLVPDADNSRKGRLLRERGYAEIVPVIGYYEMDDDGGMVLVTDYETMSSVERFWFVGPNLRMRSSTVKRFGGFSTASFCTEFRVDPEAAVAPDSEKESDAAPYVSVFGW